MLVFLRRGLLLFIVIISFVSGFSQTDCDLAKVLQEVREDFFKQKNRKVLGTLKGFVAECPEFHSQNKAQLAELYLWAGGAAYLRYQAEKCEILLSRADSLFQMTLDIDSSLYAQLLLFQGQNQLHRFGNSFAATPYFLKGLQWEPNAIQSTRFYTQLANAFVQQKDFSRALHFADLNHEVRMKYLGKSDEWTANSFQLMGNIYNERDQDSLARLNYDLAIESYELLPPGDQGQILLSDAHNNIGVSLDYAGNHEAALPHYEIAMKLREKYLGIENSDYWATVFSWGICQSNLGNLEIAKQAFADSYQYFNAKPDWYGGAIALIRLEQGLFEKEQGHYIQAISYLQDAFLIHVPAIKGNQESPLTSQNFFLEHGETIEILAEIADCMGKTGRPQAKEQAFALFEAIFDLIEQAQSGQESTDAKLAISAEMVNVAQFAIPLAWELWQESQQMKYQFAGMRFSEKVRGRLLYEENLKKKARTLLNIPPGIIEKSKKMEAEIVALEHKVKNTESDENGITLREQIVRKSLILDSIRVETGRQFPGLARLKINPELPDYSSLKRKLKTGTEYLQYFESDTCYFYFSILNTRKDSIIYRWGKISDKQKLDSLVISLWRKISTVPSLQEISVQTQEMALLLGQIYTGLEWNLRPPHNEVEKLVVSTDGKLNFLPFELLIDPEKVLPNTSFSDFPYFFKQTELEYAFSASQWFDDWEGRNLEVSKGDLEPIRTLSMSYSGPLDAGQMDRWVALNRSEAGELKHAFDEAASFKDLMGGKFLADSLASEAAFKSMVPVLHTAYLAVHGNMDPFQPDNSHLRFKKASGSSQDGKLFVDEILGLDLALDLLILSACETGAGKNIPGEGPWSLAHAFAFAGTRNILASHWKVDDESTMQLMQQFSQGYKKQGNASLALQKAKIAYLEEVHGIAAHPYYWAGMLAYGRCENEADSGNSGTILFLILLSAGLIFGMRRW